MDLFMTKQPASSPRSQEGHSPLSTERLVTLALFAAILCIASYISIPLPLPGAPHITMLNFVIILIPLLFSASESFLVVLVWMILGIVGLPVFIGGRAGIGYLIAPWGGYTLSYPLAVLLIAILRGRGYNRLRYTAAAAGGALFIDLIGMLWLMSMNHLDLKTAFLTGFAVFLPLDLLKAAAAAQIVPAFRKVIRGV